MHWMSDKRRLIFFLSVLLLTGFTLTSVIGYRVSLSAIHGEIARNQLPLTGDNIYSEIQRDLLRPVFISSVMAQDTFLRDWVLQGEKDEFQIRRFLSEIKNRYNTVTSFFISDKSRAYYHAEGILKKVSPDDSRDAWYFRVQKMASDFEINVDLDAANENAMTVFVNYKVNDYQGNYIGATGVGLTVDAVGKLIGTYQQRVKSQIYFADGKGNIVLPRTVTNGKALNIRNTPGIKSFSEQILSQRTGSFQYESDGRTNFIATRLIPELNWILIVEQSDFDAVSALRDALMVNLGISLMVTVVVLGLTLLAINVYQRRLQVMAEQEKSINQRLNSLNRQKDKLLSIVGHDLRAPFNSLLGYAEILASKAPELDRARVAEYASDVLRSGRNAHELLDSLLNWASYQWEDLNPDPESLDVAEIIRANLRLFDTIAKRKNIQLEWNESKPMPAFADPDMSDLVIRNLVNNAIKFTPYDGSVRIDASHRDSMIWVSVSDTGTGISQDHLDSIFDVDETRSTAGTDGEMGIGMGLVLCREMVETNGGTMEVESEPGKGSTFRFSLPTA